MQFSLQFSNQSWLTYSIQYLLNDQYVSSYGSYGSYTRGKLLEAYTYSVVIFLNFGVLRDLLTIFWVTGLRKAKAIAKKLWEGLEVIFGSSQKLEEKNDLLHFSIF